MIANAPRSQSLRRALLPLYVGRKSLPPVTALVGYFDDSKSGDGIVVVAGYVGHLDTWDEIFAPAWQKVLDSAPHKLSEFKTSDCRQGFGEFKPPWTRPERDDLTKKVVGVITDVCPQETVIGMANAVIVPTSDDAEWRKAAEDFAFEMCMRLTILDALEIAGRFLGVEGEVQLVFDNQPGFVERTFRHFEGVVTTLGPKLACRVGFPLFRDSKELLPLQAADLIAYETYKEIKSRAETPRRAESKALVRLLEGRYHRAMIVDTELLIDYRAALRAGATLGDLRLPPFLYNSEIPLRAEGLWLTGGQQRGYLDLSDDR